MTNFYNRSQKWREPYHFAVPSPTKEHVMSAIRLARWARLHGMRAWSVRFLQDAAEYRKWLR